MQRLSAAALICALIAVFATPAFTGKPAAVLSRPDAATTKAPSAAKGLPQAIPAAARQAMYYWFFEPSDTYNDYQTLSNEEVEMWIYYDGVLINTNPAGGTLIAEGYLSNAYPHVAFPYYYLYAHFD